MPSRDTKQFAANYNAFPVNIIAAQKAFLTNHIYSNDGSRPSQVLSLELQNI